MGTEDSQSPKLPKALLSESLYSPSANLCIFKFLIFVWFPLLAFWERPGLGEEGGELRCSFQENRDHLGIGLYWTSMLLGDTTPLVPRLKSKRFADTEATLMFNWKRKTKPQCSEGKVNNLPKKEAAKNKIKLYCQVFSFPAAFRKTIEADAQRDLIRLLKLEGFVVS